MNMLLGFCFLTAVASRVCLTDTKWKMELTTSQRIHSSRDILQLRIKTFYFSHSNTNMELIRPKYFILFVLTTGQNTVKNPVTDPWHKHWDFFDSDDFDDEIWDWNIQWYSNESRNNHFNPSYTPRKDSRRKTYKQKCSLTVSLRRPGRLRIFWII